MQEQRSPQHEQPEPPSHQLQAMPQPQPVSQPAVAVRAADALPASWACDLCTFLNSGYLQRCEMCETPRAKAPRRADDGHQPLAADTTSTTPDQAADTLSRPFESAAQATHDAPLATPAATVLAAADSQASATGGLSPAELAAFLRDGYVIVRGVVSRAECDRLLWERVAPALSLAAIDPFNEATWGGLAGTVVKAPDGGDHPIPIECPDGRWPALFDSPRLMEVLDQLHGRRRRSRGGTARRWEWAYGAAEGLGWIHIRFPVHPATKWAPPDDGWHLDRGANTTLDACDSLVALPLLTTIRPGGGGTALIRGSHTRVAELLREEKAVRPTSIARAEIHRRGAGAVVEATGAAGDVLLLHPLLVHSVSSAHRCTRTADGAWVRHGLRITFNLATRWRRTPRLTPPPRIRIERGAGEPHAGGAAGDADGAPAAGKYVYDEMLSLSPLEESLAGPRPLDEWVRPRA